jgi:hypothetical protein
MRRRMLLVGLASVAAAGCGLENLLLNAAHEEYDRPASRITGTAPEATALANISVIDADGNVIEPFLAQKEGAGYELRLPSTRYSMLRVRAVVGNMELRAIVPRIGEESSVEGIALDARSMTETLITEARLSADGVSLSRVTPEAYLGTRNLIHAGFDTPGPTQDLLHMVERILPRFDPTIGALEPSFFQVPEFNEDYTVRWSALGRGFLARNPLDYVGDGRPRFESDEFDAKLAEVAQLYRPAGCPDPDRIRLVFTVDFNEGAKNGNCGATNRFKWATDRPGKGMFFVGWIYDGSPGLPPSDIQDPSVSRLMGSSTPNVIPMYDDGTNGDEVAGDNIWSIFFDVPRSSPGNVLRIGYKYTWATSGAPWSGSEEWPGNSRILEVIDDNGDDFVYRHDVFGDEASNKDKSNSNASGSGTIDWATDLHGCGTPTSHENRYDNNSCACGDVRTPGWLGALTVTCTQ